MNDDVSNVHQRRSVGDGDDRAAIRPRPHDGVDNGLLAHAVQSGGGFIEQEHLRIAHECTRDRGTASLPRTQFMDGSVESIGTEFELRECPRITE